MNFYLKLSSQRQTLTAQKTRTTPVSKKPPPQVASYATRLAAFPRVGTLMFQWEGPTAAKHQDALSTADLEWAKEYTLN